MTKPIFTPKRALRQTTLQFKRVGNAKTKALDSQNDSKGNNVSNDSTAKDSKNESNNTQATARASIKASKEKNVAGAVRGVRKREDDKKETRSKKRKTIAPKGSNKGHISETESEDDEAVGDVSSHSWTFTKTETVSASEESESEKEPNTETSTEKDSESQCYTPAEMIKRLFLVDMPRDFYSFYEFCENLNGKNPRHALKSYGLTLVGAFDVLSGDMNPGAVSTERALCHWRFYLDPPEMQTVLLAIDGYHYGYWRDQPDAEEPFIAKNLVPDCKFMSAGANLFHVAVEYMEAYIRSCNPFEKVKAGKVLTSLQQWAEERLFTLSDTPAMINRKKKVVAATFHQLGIVVPVEPKTDVGYRPLIETNAKLKKFCLSVMNAKNDEDREERMEEIQRLVNAATIANDECDFGNGLELGLDLFCMGSHLFHNTVEHLLTTAYSLLNRLQNVQIVRAHLKYRRKGLQLSVL